ncbi:MAG: hypothetical protein QXP36_04205 [Conexivisphaerales archaeon]|uniref:hypothetical protein n=1 Tax=Saccharolobus sp. TaxID=2100761 RepID=UPI00316B6F61
MSNPKEIENIKSMLSSILERLSELEELRREVYTLKQSISNINNRNHITNILERLDEYKELDQEFTTEYETIKEQHVRPLSEMEIEEGIPKKHRLSQYPKEIQDKVNYCANLVIKLGKEMEYINAR